MVQAKGSGYNTRKRKVDYKKFFLQGYCLVFNFVRGDGVASEFETIFAIN